MTFYALRRPDGSIERQGKGKAHPSERKKGFREFKVERLGDPARERLNERGEWFEVAALAEAAIDDGHRADHGEWSIAVAQAVKLIEARRMLGLPGVVELEAAATGADPMELARQIVANADAGGLMAAELRRRKGKVTVRRKADG